MGWLWWSFGLGAAGFFWYDAWREPRRRVVAIPFAIIYTIGLLAALWAEAHRYDIPAALRP